MCKCCKTGVRESLGKEFLGSRTFELTLTNRLGVSEIVGEYDEGFDGPKINYCPMCGRKLEV